MDLAVLVLLAALVTGVAEDAGRSVAVPCDPGIGWPVESRGCPAPETGWATLGRDGDVVLQPFRTLGNDRRGRAYAAEHDLEFPYSNDYLDVATSSPARLELRAETACTGVILVGRPVGMRDHRVDCDAIVTALEVRAPRIPVAVWRRHGWVVQVSELYRP